MQKPADAKHPLHDLIKHRWSPLGFDPRPIEPEKIGSLLEAARWAPSSYNEQPWAYIIATRDQPAEFQKLIDCLADGNKPWTAHVPLLMLAVAKLHFEKNGKPNRHAQHDVGLAGENLVIQAAAMGLAVHQMAGFDPDKARKTFNIPEGFEPLTMIAIGYEGDASKLPQNYIDRENAPRSRKPLASMVFTGAWGHTAEIAK